jgi:hypothetical protein
MVRRPLRLTGTSRTTPSGWLPRVPGAWRPRAMPSLPVSRPLCRSTSRQASVRETPSAAARDCVGRRRTPPVDGRWRCCPGSGGKSHWCLRERHHASIMEFENFSSVKASMTQSTDSSGCISRTLSIGRPNQLLREAALGALRLSSRGPALLGWSGPCRRDRLSTAVGLELPNSRPDSRIEQRCVARAVWSTLTPA